MEMKDLRMHGEDLQGFDMFSQNHQEIVVGKEDEEIWFETASQHHQNNCNSVANNNNNNENNNKNSNNEEFLGVDVSDPTSLFYAEFPPLPDFPCMSSSSSSSSTPAASKPFMTSATSSSASTASSGTASWAVLKSDADHDPSSVSMDNGSQHQQGGGGGGEGGGMVLDDVDQCMDMMENFGCIDLLESSDICWDPSPLFEDENGHGHGNEHDDNQQQQHVTQQQQQQQEQTLGDDDDEENVFRQFMLQNESNCSDNTNDNNCNIINLGQTSSGVGGGGGIIQQESLAAGEDLGMVFFEWLKSNKEMVSAEDLRNIKIKKSTIDSAAKRLGGGKEGVKQLLKLILQWVQNHHLQSKRIMMIDDDVPNTVAAVTTTTATAAENNNINNNVYSSNNNHDNNIIANSNPNPNTDLNCMSPSTWMTPPPPPYAADMGGMVPVAPPPSGFAPMAGYMGGDPYGNGYPPPIPGSDFHSWAGTPHYGMGPYGPYTDPGFGGYGAAYPAGFYYHPGPGEGLVRLGSSATKEARKKRMARQRRFFTHQHRSHAHHNQGINLNQHNQGLDMNNGNCGVGGPHPGHANWMYWPHPQPQQVVPPPQVNQSVAGAGPVVGQMAPPQEKVGANGLPRQVGGVEKKQGWKTEKNLRFLLQKVLKQSDVGNLGRIVLPKKEAETHLPELEARDGIPIAMEDIGTSRVWNMRYRFWPNNKSRMYLLENTGDFVRSNGLQEGDFIVIYSDVKCGKYMIRGVKVRPQQPGSKPETPTSRINDKPRKTQKTQGTSTPAGNDPPSSPCMME